MSASRRAPDVQWESAGRLAGEGLGDIVDVIGGVHDAVAERVESALPAGARGIASLSRRHARSVYAIVGAAHRQVPAVAGRLAPEGDVEDTAAGRAALPVVNGLWGDRIAAREPSLAVPMAVRMHGADVAPDRESLARSFPDAGERVVVFIHGLCSSERDWRWRRGEVTTTYGRCLEDDLGVTSLEVRYNTGLRISENGRRLSALLAEVVGNWPVPVSSLTLVGHSMGGLVARSACHEGGPWTEVLESVISLGTPHLGSPVEKSVHVADRLLRVAPESRPLGDFLARRSVGVKDLRYGAIAREDWAGHDPDEFLRDRCTDVPMLPEVTYYWVSATLTREGGLGRLVGDGLVRPGSASGEGRARRIGFDLENGAHLERTGHLTLLHDEAVYEHLLRWCA